MTYIPDMAPYFYSMCFEPVTRAIGWLDHPHTYPTGPVDGAVLDRLWSLCSTRDFVSLNFSHRGAHSCSLCPPHHNVGLLFHYGGQEAFLGSAEIRVFDPDGEVYAAPNLIMHYICDHHYQPPSAFCAALCVGPHVESDAYQVAIRRLAMWRYASMPFGLEYSFGVSLPFTREQVAGLSALELLVFLSSEMGAI